MEEEKKPYSPKKKRNIPLKEKCPKCQASKFAESKDLSRIRYCTFSKEQGYDGIGSKGCGAIWQPMSQDEIKLDNMTRKHREMVSEAKKAKELLHAFEKAANGKPPAEVITPMGILHSDLKQALAIISNSIYT